MRNKRQAIVFLLGIFIWCTSNSFALKNSLVPTLYTQGINFYSQKKYKAALEHLEHVVSLSPTHDQARYYLIYCFLDQKLYGKALKHAQILSLRFPQNVSYAALVKQIEQIGKGKTFVKNSYQEKKFYSAKKKRIAKSKIISEIGRARTLIFEGEYEAASSILEKHIKKGKNISVASHLMGLLLFEQRKYSESIKFLEKAKNKKHKSFENTFTAGLCYLKLNQLKKAKKYFKKALQLKIDLFCQLHLAEVYFKLKEYSEAKKLCGKIRKAQPDIKKASILLAQINLKQGKSSLASSNIKKIINDNSSEPEVLYVSGKLLLQDKRYSEALKTARIAYTNSPDNMLFKSFYALTLIRNLEINAGLKIAQEILNAEPKNVEAMLVVAEAKIMMGKKQEAEIVLKNAQKIENLPEISFFLATIAIERKNIVLGKQLFKEYLKLSKNSPVALFRYAQFHETYGSCAESKKAYKEITKSYGKSKFAVMAKKALARISSSKKYTPNHRRFPIPGF